MSPGAATTFSSYLRPNSIKIEFKLLNDELRVIRTLNQLRDEGLLRAYALFGASAMTYWDEPIATVDLDFVILVDTDEEFIPGVFTAVGKEADRVEGLGFIFGDTPVELFPSNIHPIYREAVDNAAEKMIPLDDGSKLVARVARPEHLILFGLLSWRPKDRLRVAMLREIADETEIWRLIEKHDQDGTFAERYRSVSS